MGIIAGYAGLQGHMMTQANGRRNETSTPNIDKWRKYSGITSQRRAHKYLYSSEPLRLHANAPYLNLLRQLIVQLQVRMQ
jgi:hypothetical protein